jgi:hypothetical protein
VHLAHGSDLSAVQMETRASYILRGFGIFQDGDGIVRVVAVVIVQNDLGIEAGCLKTWSLRSDAPILSRM